MSTPSGPGTSEAEREQMEAEFSDYHDGSLPPAKKAAFEARLAADADFRAEWEKFKHALSSLSGLHRMAAPQKFDEQVAQTIHRRSGGRFFGRKAFGDRVPFELIAIVALVLAAVVFLLMRFSLTGAVHEPLERHAPAPADAGARSNARDIMPQP
jgi:anti-sigma factor RsiW